MQVSIRLMIGKRDYNAIMKMEILLIVLLLYGTSRGSQVLDSTRLHSCLNQTAVLVFGDSTVRGTVECLLGYTMGHFEQRLEGNPHFLSEYTHSGFRVYFAYNPQLSNDYHRIPKVSRYHRGTNDRASIEEFIRNANISKLFDDHKRDSTDDEQEIDYFVQLIRRYQQDGDRQNVVILVGGIALSESTIDAVMQWKRVHQSAYKIIFKSNGPRMPSFVTDYKALNVCKTSSEHPLCEEAKTFQRKRIANNLLLKKYVERFADNTVIWWDTDEVLYRSWPTHFHEDHCMCHFHESYPTYRCYSNMEDVVKSLVPLICTPNPSEPIVSEML